MTISATDNDMWKGTLLPGLLYLSCTAEYQNREQEYSGIILVFGSAAQADFQIFGRIFGGTLGIADLFGMKQITYYDRTLMRS